MKLVDYSLMLRTCARLQRQPENICVYFHRKHLSSAVPEKQKHGYLREKINEFILWYDEFTGMDEVRSAQRRVLEDEENFRRSQDDRRKVLTELQEIQSRLKDLNNELDNTAKSDDRYVALVTQEHKLLKEERAILDKFSMAERIERDSFSALSSSVKLSHEKERAQSERTKYWSLIASAVGTVIGILGTSINNHFKMNELKELIRGSSNKELLNNINTYLEMNESILNHIKNNPKTSYFNNNNSSNNRKIEELLSKMDKKLGNLENDLRKIEQKNRENISKIVRDSEDGTAEIDTVEALSDKVEQGYTQMKFLLFTIAFLSILMPFISKNV